MELQNVVSKTSATAAAVMRHFPVRGRTRIAWRLAHSAHARRSDAWWDVPMKWGGNMRLPSSSDQAWRAAFSGTYDSDEQLLFSAFIRPNMLIIDIGACFGLWTLPIAIHAKRVGADVLAIEPVPANATILRDNLRSNGLTDSVQVHELALGESGGTACLTVESSNGGNAAVGAPAHPVGVSRATAPMIRLDDLVPNPANAGGLIKIDAEGFELDILRGAPHLINRLRPVILGEFSAVWFAYRGVNVLDLGDWAAEHEYAVFEVKSLRRTVFRDHRMYSVGPKVPAAACNNSLLLIPDELTLPEWLVRSSSTTRRWHLPTHEIGTI